MGNLFGKAVEVIKKPVARVTDVDLKDVSREAITYSAKVAVTNPYPIPIPISDISYSFKSAGRVIASGKIPDPGTIKGSGETMMEVELKVPYDVLISLARDIGADGDIDYELDLGFTMDLPLIGNFTLPLSQKGQIKLPTFSDLFN